MKGIPKRAGHAWPAGDTPEHFATLATGGLPWWSEANQLRRAALAIWERQLEYDAKTSPPQREPSIFPQALFLYALALENALKGWRLVQEPHLVKGGKLDQRLVKHDLARLAGAAGLTTRDPDEADFLEFGTHLILVDGRYPIPKASSGRKNTTYNPARLRAAFERLFVRAGEGLARAMYRPGWQINGRSVTESEWVDHFVRVIR